MLSNPIKLSALQLDDTMAECDTTLMLIFVRFAYFKVSFASKSSPPSVGRAAVTSAQMTARIGTMISVGAPVGTSLTANRDRNPNR